MSSPALLAIGDFSRATQLSVKMLRHSHQIGLLEPVDVDRATGYRRYSTDQIPTAQIIRRFRTLEMPLDEIRTVMSTNDIRQRNDLINAHLTRLETQLAQTTRAVESLRELLEPGLLPKAGSATAESKRPRRSRSARSSICAMG